MKNSAVAAAALLLTIVGAARLAIQVPRLVAGGPEVFGAVDLGFRHREVRAWFAGEPVYGALDTAVYPPATYPLLWPFLGWLPFPAARALWAATGLAALAWLAALLARGGGAEGWRERLLLAAFAAAHYATGVTLAAGQMLVHLLPALVAGALLLARPGPATVRRDLAAAGLLLFGLAKPNAALPFLAPALLKPGRLRPTALVVAGYAALTLFSLSFQTGTPTGLAGLAADWHPTAAGVAATSGYGHLGVWLAALGLERWLHPASLIVATAFAAWTWRHRDADPWVLLGVAAVVARIWTYHQYYDDVLMLVPAAAVFRVAKQAADPRDRSRARRVFGAAVLAGLAPTSLAALPGGWDLWLFEVPQMLVWGLMLWVLGRGAGPGPQLRPAAE